MIDPTVVQLDPDDIKRAEPEIEPDDANTPAPEPEIDDAEEQA